jgi:HSP20 family protein
MYSSNRQGSRSWLGDIFGFDPLNLMRGADAFGITIERTDDGYRIEMPVAGFRPEEINITVEDRQLVVEGRNERRRFTQAIVLPEEIDAERIGARVDHGMLTLMLPLNAKTQPRRIQVQPAGQQQAGISDSGQQPGMAQTGAAGASQAGQGQTGQQQTGQPQTVQSVSGETKESGDRTLQPQGR